MSFAGPEVKNRFSIDEGKLKGLLPKSFDSVQPVFELGDKYSMSQSQVDQVEGRAFCAELQHAIEQSKPQIVAELIDLMRSNQLSVLQQPTQKDRYEKYRQSVFAIKQTLYTGLNFYSRIYFPEGPIDAMDGDLWIIKDQFIRAIKLSLLLELLKDPQFADLVEIQLQVAAADHKAMLDSGDTAALFFSRIDQDDYFTVMENREFRRKFSGIKPITLKANDRALVNTLGDEVFGEILAERDYDMENIYTYDNNLGSPLVEVFQNCGADWTKRNEAIAAVLLDGDKNNWQTLLQTNRSLLADLSSGEGTRRTVHGAVKKVFGENEPPLVDSECEKLQSGIGFYFGSQVVTIRWTDGELVIPNAQLPFKELFPENEQDWVGVLRLSLLLKLRSLLVQDRPDDTEGAIRILRKRKKNISKATTSQLRDKIFPREQKLPKPIFPPRLPDEDFVSEEPLPKDPHHVTGHKRDLPDGFYATPQAVERARQLGIDLDFIIDEKGFQHYIQTYVRTHQRGGDHTQVDRKGRFPGDAAE